MIWPSRAEKQRTLPSAIFLAVNNNTLEDFSGDFRFLMKITSFRRTCTTRGAGPSQVKFSNF